MTASPFVILYVEDDDFVRESIAELLATAERQVVCVADGAGARAALRERNVNLLITDINLPDGSGLDLAREGLRQNPTLPVIVCSGHDLTEVSQSLGPTAHPLTKPFDMDELAALAAFPQLHVIERGAAEVETGIPVHRQERTSYGHSWTRTSDFHRVKMAL
jgi:DNA-binding response OmpR family regulator